MTDMYVGKKKEKLIHKIHWKTVVNSLSMTIGIATIASAVYIFLFVEERLKWLPLMFLGAAFVNLIEGMKKFYYCKHLSGFLFILTTLVITAFAAVSYMVLWKPV